MIARWLSAGGRVRVAAIAVLVMAGGACDKMPLTAPTESTIQLSAAPTVPLNGSVDVVATVIEGSGTPVQNGTLVSFTATLGHVEPSEARTENGKVTVKFVAGAQSGLATVTALSGAATGTSTDSGSTDTTAPLGARVSIKIGGAAAKTVTLRADPATVPHTGGTVTLTAQVVDENGGALSGVPVSFAASAGLLQSSSVITNSSGEASTTLTAPGPATVTATAGAVTSEAVEITVAALPTIELSASPNPATSGQAVTFSINLNITNATNPVRNVRIEFGDGDFEDLGAVTSTTVSHIYNNDGAYNVKVTVTDSAGQQATQVRGLTVLPNAPVTVTLVISPSNPAPKGLVGFTATVAPIPGVNIERYDWDFGDGSPTLTTTGNSTSKTYTAAKTYKVKVTVHASDGSTGVAALDLVIT